MMIIDFPELIQWSNDEHRIIILKGNRGEVVPVHYRLYSSNYIILNDNGTFIVIKNRNGDLEFLRKLLSEQLQVEFVLGNDTLELAESEDLAILRLKGIL